MGAMFSNSNSGIVEESKSGVISFTPKNHTSTIIFLHGLGDTAEGWADVGRIWCKKLPETRIVLPTAPIIPVTLNGGVRMPSWYDILGMGEEAALQAPLIEHGQKVLMDIFEEELKKVDGDASRIILGGFSMGGALALFTALQQPKLCGVLVVSGYIVTPQNVNWNILSKDTPILQCHGTSDFMVPFTGAQKTLGFIQTAGFKNVELKHYSGLQHGTCDKELNDILQWLRLLCPARATDTD